MLNSVRTKKMKVPSGTDIGILTGVVAATVATFWGGYEVGSAINDKLGVDGLVGRATLDAFVMGALAAPSYAAGICGGFYSGQILDCLIWYFRK
jgi:hypothetical protein